MSNAYRYGFNGKENDNEVKGQGNQQDYGMRIYDPRIGKFLSVDPITSQYPSLTPYQFSSNSPIANIDLDGLEAKLAIAGKGGEGTAYTSSDIVAFDNRAKQLKNFGFNSVSINSGQMLVDVMRNATKTEGSISAIVSFAHGGSNGIFLNNNQGFYTANTATAVGSSDVSHIVGSVNAGEIKFTKNAVWIFASCNAGNADVEFSTGKVGTYNLARNTAQNLGITTIGARGFVSEINENGKGTGVFSVGPYHDTEYDNMQFIKFVPVQVKVTQTVKHNATFLGIKLPWYDDSKTEKIEKVVIKIKEVPLGPTIKATDYVPKTN